jgi:hypothetical protein
VTIERDLSFFSTEFRLENSVIIMASLMGGLALLVWLLFYILDYCWTITKFKNYMASELYTVGENDFKEMVSARGHLPLGFHNEIIPVDGKTLNLTKVGFCCRLFCCCSRGNKIFSKARDMTATELNISSIVKSQRDSKASLELLRSSMDAAMVDQVI